MNLAGQLQAALCFMEDNRKEILNEINDVIFATAMAFGGLPDDNEANNTELPNPEDEVVDTRPKEEE